MRTPIVAGNWKMNGSLAMARELAQAIAASDPSGSGVEVILCPPATLLHAVSEVVAQTAIQVGAQDIDKNESGAFTGQTSAALARDAGATYTLAGHSERRILYSESDELVAEKVAVALGAGLIPILCLGETREQREAGHTSNIVDRQLNAVLDRLGIDAFERIVIAYEPVWAIGTGLTATPDQAQQVHAHIRKTLAARDSGTAAACRILYGGSMKPDNADALTAQQDIDGGLVGGASLHAPDFLSICTAAARSHA